MGEPLGGTAMPKMDTQHLERIKHRWHCVLDVPAALVPTVGRKRLRQSLGTTSLAEARQRRHPVLAEFQAVLADARRGVSRKPRRVEFFDGVAAGGSPVARAMTWRDDLANARRTGDAHAAEVVALALHDEAERLAAVAGDDAARSFVAVAEGRETPLSVVLPGFMAETRYPERTKGEVERTAKLLEEWAAGRGRVVAVETFTKREGGQFITDALVGGGLEPTTVAKKVTLLSVLWRWAAGKGYVEEGRNPWLGQAKPKVKAHQRDASEQERPFTDDEVVRLLAGPADAVLADLMRMAALSGARLEELFTLRVRDCNLTPGEEAFTIPKGKTASAARTVPIHPDTLPIFVRRCADKAAGDFLFHEEGSEGPGGERSMAVSKRFGYYRQRIGVEDRPEGKRRSLVNFHSWRRWFATKAEQAGQPMPVIDAVGGWKRPGMAAGRYSAGPSFAQRRACVEAVRLPALPADAAAPKVRPVVPRRRRRGAVQMAHPST